MRAAPEKVNSMTLKSKSSRLSAVPKAPPEPIELKFKGIPSEVADQETFEALCLDLSKAVKNFEGQVEKFSKKHNLSLTVETYFDLTK